MQIAARLCHDVLARATDTDKASAILDLDNEHACQLLHDAMVILASKDIKIATSARKASGDFDADIEVDSQPATAATITSAATAKVLSQVCTSIELSTHTRLLMRPFTPRRCRCQERLR